MKKNGYGVPNGTAMLILKCLLFMKLTLIAICLFSMQSMALNVNGQEKITLDLHKASLKKAFQSIQKQTSFRFIYNDEMLPEKQDISINAHGESLNVVMEKLLAKTTLSYKVMNQNMVVISEKGVFTDVDAQTITGKVVNEKNEPLANVSIIEKGTNNGTSTKEDGSFTITVSKNDAILVVSSVGYVSQEINLNGRSSVTINLALDNKSLSNVVVIGYGTKKKEAVTSAISVVTAKDLEDSKNGSTVSTALAGKIPGVTFRQGDGRPGSSASISIRNMGQALYVIDGIQQDEGQFNNIAPSDIDNITVLKDAAAAIYGVQAANGVILVTTKRGQRGTANTIGVNAYTGWQNWSRFPKVTNAYEWQRGKVEADVNQGRIPIAADVLDKYKSGTLVDETGDYRSFDWYKFIIKPNAPLTNLNLNFTGGSDKVNYYVSLTNMFQNSVLGREYKFNRTNFQSNIDAQVTKSFKIGAQINGRVEDRQNPGNPGGDDYWSARFAILRNTPMERPYANDNPAYLNNIGHNDENWGRLNNKIGGHYQSTWRVLQTNLNAEWKTPLPGLTLKGLFSYYYANNITNNHEYTYKAYTYDKATDTYNVTGGSDNPWQERGTTTILTSDIQLQANYSKSIGKHNIDVSFVNERNRRQDINFWFHDVPPTNYLDQIQFSSITNDPKLNDDHTYTTRVGYVGRFAYNYDSKYYFDLSGRRDASYILSPDKKWGTFPAASVGWRLTKEDFFSKWVEPVKLSELKLRASYGLMGDDRNLPIDAFSWMNAYQFGGSGLTPVILNGDAVIRSKYRGVPVTNVSWITSRMLDVGLDYGFFNNKLTGTIDYFRRKRDNIPGSKYDVLVPSELGYGLPQESLKENQDMVKGFEFSISYATTFKHDIHFRTGANFTFARAYNISSYKPTYYNSWDYYKNNGSNRPQNIFWGYECIGQFQSQEQINNYKVDQDGVGNKSLLPGSLMYKDLNGDGIINDYDTRPIGWGEGRNPLINGGFNFGADYKGFDVRMDFSFGSGYSFNKYWETRWPYQNTGNLLKTIYDDHWHHTDIYDVNSPWIAGKYPAMTFDYKDRGNDYGRNSTFWLVNVHYIRCRNIEVGYSLPTKLIEKLKMKKARVYVNATNLFSMDNMRQYGMDAEISDANGLTYPQSKYVNVGVNLNF